MAATPDRVKWWKAPSQNATDLFLLSQKMFARFGCQGTPDRIASSEVRGFQFGDPAVAPYCVKLDLFDAAGHHYAMTITSGARGPVIKQAEVNAMVASLRQIGGK
jgi:hypothetical protein